MPRVMEIATPLGDDVLLFHGMHAREELSRLSEYQLDLLSVEEGHQPRRHPRQERDREARAARRQHALLQRLRDAVLGGRQSYGRYHRYFAVVRPWLWFLTRTSDCRIFQEMTVPDIIKKVFGDRKDGRFQVRADGHLPEVDLLRAVPGDRLQLRQPADGGGRHLLLLQAHGRPQHGGAHRFHRQAHGDSRLREDPVHLARAGREAGARAHQQLGFLARDPAGRLRARRLRSRAAERRAEDAEGRCRAPTRRATTRSTTTPATTCRRRDGEQYAGVRIDELGSQFETAQAVTNAKGVCVGSLFTLEDCPREDQNREHLILAASYDLEFSDYEAMPEGAGTSYRCSFVAMSSEQQFRPQRTTPKPFVQGPQTAVVVGPGGDEIYTDKYGRVKVQFHWDRLRQEGREQLVLDPRVAAVGGQGLGLGLDAAHRPGGDRRFPRRRSRSADHHRARLQRREPAAVRVPGRRGAERHQVANAQGRPATTSCRWTTRPGRRRSPSTASTTWTPSIEHDQTSTIHNNRTDRVDVDDSESVGNNQKWDVGVNRDAKIGVERDADGRREPDEERRRRTRRSRSGRTATPRSGPASRRPWRCSARTPSASTRRSRVGAAQELPSARCRR